MTADAFASFLARPEQDRRDAFAAAARRLDTVPGYVEKDFWVCLVLDLLFNRLPAGHPKLLFKGGTSLSKAFGLIPAVLGGHRSRGPSRRPGLRRRPRPDDRDQYFDQEEERAISTNSREPAAATSSAT